MRHFVECVRDGVTPRETYEDGYIVNCILDAGYQSMRKKQWVRVKTLMQAPAAPDHGDRQLSVPGLAGIRLAASRSVWQRRSGGVDRGCDADRHCTIRWLPGIDVISDGEQTRLDFNLVVLWIPRRHRDGTGAARRFGPPAHDQRGKHEVIGDAPRSARTGVG